MSNLLLFSSAFSSNAFMKNTFIKNVDENVFILDMDKKAIERSAGF